MFGISAFAQTPYSSLASTTHFGVANVNGVVSVTCDMFSTIFASCAITVSGLVAASGILTKLGIANVNGSGVFTGSGFRIFLVSPAVSVTTTVTAKGYRLGEEWTTSTAGTETWTTATAGTETWTTVSAGSNTWSQIG